MSDLICVQTAARGKWHVDLGARERKTVCGIAYEDGASFRYLSLIDSRDRCKERTCAAARYNAGLKP